MVILIVGYGKAGLIHEFQYKSMPEIDNIYIIDNLNNMLDNIKKYKTIGECIEKNKLHGSDIVVDICTPISEYRLILKECKKYNVNKVLIEKPFLINKELYDMDIVMVENYLYSLATIEAKKYIISNKCRIRKVYANFSKNRMKDSLNKRGFGNKELINFEIEFPHMIYLIRYLTSTKFPIRIDFCSCDNMKIDNFEFKNHGYGIVIGEYGDIPVIMESDLSTYSMIRRVVIICEEDIIIEINYAHYSKEKIIKPTEIKIKQKGEIIISKKYNNDNNFKLFLKRVINYFSATVKVNPDLIDIKDFQVDCLKIINSVMENNVY